MECFRIDESGYTGHDLLNPEQRFQGATAIAIDDDEAKRLIREHFPKLQADELKYRALARRPANRPRLMALQRDVLTHHRCVTYVCDKRYLLLLMFMDYAVEPFYYERGMDFYEDGQNYSLASLLHVTGPTLLGAGALDRLLASFQRAVKEKSSEALADLVKAARASRWQELPEALGPLAQFAAPECLQAIATPGVTTDAAFVVLQSLVSRMEAIADGPYRVEHDQSKNLLTYHDLLERYIRHEDVITFRQSEIASITFPLKLQSVTQVDSKSSPAVQLADVMIGAAIEAANTLTGQRAGALNAREVMALYADHQLIHMLPSIDFEEQKRFRQGTQAARVIDYFAENFRKP
ncbi:MULTISPECIES: DUF3800 domain-containing protein [Xanthomonas]|uniref:DUF3800 domain-containing protein n=1 Tax=Xanthomonas TaxID=338 RepID=UPI001A17E501|nr:MULTISPECIES: DUF3800 domain-containing protein [Xanthomonas]MBF9173755.1 DUF3800 domain-containing protein [Xanthomonas campestris pv. campestris]MBV6851382.1 DUF3800 domain-containing protein [Xanthomonas campestris pv. heliotropii]MCF8796343.1 DUF3800 domain-containing protein [Xanthomonas campestris pv. campestris]MCF8811893.1 DUF3800 domain-containing protein [Xanthomonas campestris pv. campestris]MDO0847919.1 DUF3800 domain-containing protein [Xanthomonas campestris pv. campestris]